MASLTLDENRSLYQIHSFKPGTLTINNEAFSTSVIISPTQLIRNWPPQSILDLKKEHLSKILDLKPTIVLIGTGTKLTFLPVDLYGDLINAGIGVEIMDTAAACRTYNALSAEERQVAAALIIR